MTSIHAEALKRNGIDYDEAMDRFGGNEALFERLASKFLDDTHFAALEQALADGDDATALREGDSADAKARMEPVRIAYEAVKTALSSLDD